MSDLEYGYLGNAPTQAQTSNTGVFSTDDVYDLKSNDKWTLSIPRENLLQYQDKRFYTSGSTWADQSGNGNNASFSGTISQTTNFSSDIGEFYYPFSTSAYLNLGTGGLSDLSSNTWTWCWVGWADFSNGSENNYGLSCATSSNNNLHIMGNPTNDGYETYNNRTVNTSVSTDYQFVAYKYSGANTKVYTSRDATTYTAGGTQNDLSTTQGFVLNQEQDSVLGGFQSSQTSRWYISAFMIYDEIMPLAKIQELERYFKQYYPIASTL